MSILNPYSHLSPPPPTTTTEALLDELQRAAARGSREDDVKGIVENAADVEALLVALTSHYAANVTVLDEEVVVEVVDTQAALFLATICVLHLAVFATYLRHRSFIRFIAQLTVAVIVVSVPWTWWDMYSQEVNKIHAEAMTAMGTEEYRRCMAIHTQAPSFVTSFMDTLGRTADAIFQKLVYVSRKKGLGLEDDACTRYRRFMLSQPLWAVTPTHALAVTLSRFFFEPSEHVGGAIKRFVVALLDDVPVALYPLLLFSVLCLVGGLAFVACGYRLSLGHLVVLEPTAAALPPPPPTHFRRKRRDKYRLKFR